MAEGTWSQTVLYTLDLKSRRLHTGPLSVFEPV